MCEIAFSIPNEVLYDTKMSKQDTLAFAKRAVALCYYTQSKVSLGYCAQIADMSKEEFIRYLGANNADHSLGGYRVFESSERTLWRDSYSGGSAV